MTEADIINIAQNAIYTGIKMSAPALILGLAVGLIIAIFQATTQINEQTLVFIPKILAVAAALIIFGPWILQTIIGFTVQLYGSINNFIGI